MWFFRNDGIHHLPSNPKQETMCHATLSANRYVFSETFVPLCHSTQDFSIRVFALGNREYLMVLPGVFPGVPPRVSSKAQ